LFSTVAVKTLTFHEIV